MTAADWITEGRRFEQAATKGPWIAATGAYAWDDDDEATHVWYHRPIGDGTYEAIGRIVDNTLDQTTPADAEFIADARTALPKALDALEAVLALWPDTADPCDCCVHVDCEVVRAITEALT